MKPPSPPIHLSILPSLLHDPFFSRFCAAQETLFNEEGEGRGADIDIDDRENIPEEKPTNR